MRASGKGMSYERILLRYTSIKWEHYLIQAWEWPSTYFLDVNKFHQPESIIQSAEKLTLASWQPFLFFPYPYAYISYRTEIDRWSTVLGEV